MILVNLRKANKLVITFIVAFLFVFPGSLSAQQPSPTGSEAEQTTSSYESLLNLLEDEALRERLVEDLRTLQDPRTADDSEAATNPSFAEDKISLSRQIAQTTRATAEFLFSLLDDLDETVSAIEIDEEESDEYLKNLGLMALDILIIIVFTITLFILLRNGARRLYTSLNRQAESQNRLVLRGAVVLLSSTLDALAVVFAWVGGYVLALFVIGEFGQMDDRHALFLNAFLLVELIKVVLRLMLSPSYSVLRILRINDEDAAYWYAWLGRLLSVLGYGLLLLVPIVQHNLSDELGHALAVLIGAVVLLMAVVLVLQNRKPIGSWLHQRAQQNDMTFTRSLLFMLARCWHLIAITYLATLFIVSLLHPEDALPFMLTATLESIVVVVLGIAVSFALSRVISVGVHLSDDMRRNLPMLEQRLNAYVPTILRIVRLIVFATVLLVLLHAWDIFDLAYWLSEGGGGDLLSVLITVGLILLVAMFLWLAVASWVEHRLNPDLELSGRQASARERTLLAIFRNAFAVILTILTVMIVLSEIGLDIGPLLAGAGVLGLAIGFGAQRMVQDVITGVFIQLENALNVGDVVTVSGITGTVEKLTIRSAGIRDLHGTYHLVSFAQVDYISNFMRDFGYHVGEYRIAYHEDIDHAIARLQEAFEELRNDPDIAPSLIDDLEVFGVIALDDSSVKIRVRIKTEPGMQWGVGRAYNQLVKKHFEAAGIEIPFPHMTLYFGEDKDGTAPPLRLMQLRAEAQNTREEDLSNADPEARKAALASVSKVQPGEEFDNAVTDAEDADSTSEREK
ncbi:mechanosensitive ion channel domain-containing protein [Fodinicurvata halophila]|uniref:Mechanosensitive ion channel domain-containing protein n=1 Tax=Fodinicurvata halophila TaxID=1419723 RepID=A0ABV8UQV7_9PROT